MNWKNLSTPQKIIAIISIVAAIPVVAAMIKPDLIPINPTYPAISVLTLFESVVYWEKKRKWAYLLIFGAVICMFFFALELFLLS